MTAASIDGSSRFTLIPLTIQPEGEVFLVGNQQLGTFYQFPAEGVALLRQLQEGRSPADIRCLMSSDGIGEEIDLDDFLGTLIEIGFARPGDEALAAVASSAPVRTLGFSVSRATAERFFSRGAVALYGLVVAVGLVCAVRFPVARLHADAFFIEDNLAATLILLLVLSSAATGLHELGHMLAAAREGVASRLGIGTRLWNLVFEADLSGIFALPRARRYLPLLAGMLVDLLVVSVVTILITALSLVDAPVFAVALLQALVLQIAVTVAWQFNLFLRTDVYYLLSNWSGHPNLDGAARDYIAGNVHRWTAGRFGRRQSGQADGTSARYLRMVRCFVAVWILGRILALATLFLVVLPTLARYAERAWRTIQDPDVPVLRGLDAAIFAGLSMLLVAAGLTLWLLPKFRHQKPKDTQ